MTPYAAMGLRANPFAPVQTINGQVIEFDYSKGPLTPRHHAYHLQYYFDLYSWRDGEQLGRLADDGSISAFPNPVGQTGTIIVISGVSGTGRTSLEELLFYEIGKRAESLPIVTTYAVRVTARPARDAADFAHTFIDDVEEHLESVENKLEALDKLPERLRARVADWLQGPTEEDRNTELLFSRLAKLMRKALPKTPIVFHLDATNYLNTPDTWMPICRMLRQLADYVVLSLSEKDDASYLRTSLQDHQVRIYWIDTPRLDAEKMKRFLTRRLAVERDGTAPAGDELFPFTGDALAKLFAGTGKASVEHPISVAIQILRGAFDRKYADIRDLLAAQPPRQIQPTHVRITGADMERYFSK